MGDLSGMTVRVVHIFCGAFWVGAALMLTGFIEPAIRAMGPEGGRFMHRLMGPGRFGIYMSAAGLLTALSGLTLLWLGSGGELRTWLESGYGKAILVGSVVGMAGLIWGLAINAPTAARLARAGQELQSAGAPPGSQQLAEISRLQKRLHVGGLLSAFLLGLSLIAMAAAHYF